MYRQCFVFSFSYNSRIYKGTFHGLELSLARLQRSARYVANAQGQSHGEQISDVILHIFD